MERTFYRDLFGGWRWELRLANGEVTDSKESYDTREECVKAASEVGARIDPTRRAGQQNSSSPVAPPRSLLCVLGSRELRATVEEGLADYRVVCVDSALDAMRTLRSGLYDGYVLDYWISDWSGVQLCREIRRADAHAPVCFYTAAGTEDQRRRALRAGADAYVCVPAGIPALRDELASLIERAALRSLNARIEEERAISEELSRLRTVAVARSEHARQLTANATERIARIKGQAAFLRAGGTAADFERWWPQVYADTLDSRPPPRDDPATP